MKNFILTIIFTIIAHHLLATVVPQGSVSGVWDLGNSPYIVEGDICVEIGDTLHIRDGVEVIFTGNNNLTVSGKLLVTGSENNHVVFTANNNITRGWKGLYFDHSSGSSIEYAKFENISHVNALRADSCEDFNLSNCIFTDLESHSIDNFCLLYIYNSSGVEILSNVFSNNRGDGQYTKLINIAESNSITFESNHIFDNQNFLELVALNFSPAENNSFFCNNTISNNESQSFSDMSSSIIRITNRTGNVMQISDNLIEKNANHIGVGGALMLIGNGFCVKDNKILNNRANSGGGIYFDYQGTGYASLNLFENNMIYENNASYGGGVYVEGKGSGCATFKYNDICQNKASVNSGGMYLKGLGGEFSTSYLIGNQITFNESPSGAGIYLKECSGLAIYNNNIVYNEGDGVCVTDGTDGGCSMTVFNTNIWSNTGYQVRFQTYYQNNTLTSHFSYCNIEGTTQGILGRITTDYTYDNLIDVEPDFVDKYSFNWHLSNPVSQLMHGGPVDETSMAIGSFIGVYPYTEEYSISYYSRDLYNGWTWLSFPILERDEDNDSPVDILTITNLLDLNGVEIQHERESIYFEYFWSTNDALSDIRSSLGYKIKTSCATNITTTGTTLNPNTIITLYPNQENWIGYFIPRTMLIEDALGPQTLQYLSEIKTQKWSMKRQGNEWLQNSVPKTISFGDMVILVTNLGQEMNFTWQNGVPPIVSAIPCAQLFSFQEQADYIPVYIEMDTDTPPLEIGLFVNGECRGAAVYDGRMTEIQAYLLPEDSGQEVYFDFAYGAKAPALKPDNYLIVNPNNMQEENIPFIAQAGKRYYHIKFTKDQDLANEKTYLQLNQNYPNPFNPTTNISFYLSKDDHVRLAIYNIKGQKVKELFNGMKTAGTHVFEWDGKDSNQKEVKSGVYFYKVETKTCVVQKKMTLIK